MTAHLDHLNDLSLCIYMPFSIVMTMLRPLLLSVIELPLELGPSNSIYCQCRISAIDWREATTVLITDIHSYTSHTYVWGMGFSWIT